jgi:hypothetical protein
MNEEQNKAGTDSENNGGASERASITNNTSQSTTTSDADASGTPNSEYYAVDHAKKDVISTIGDGEMHDEGLVGAGEATTDIQTSMERLTEEQDIAESHDSEQ